VSEVVPRADAEPFTPSTHLVERPITQTEEFEAKTGKSGSD
jgi:hypothetical protein